MKRVGFTTTIPVEILLAAERVPVDLNNIFITSKSPLSYIEFAEDEGLPRNTCSWIKGIYATVIKNSIDEVIGVVEGDCSNTHALMELFRDKKISVIPFAFPYGESDKYDYLKKQMEKLLNHYGIGWEELEKVIVRVDRVREKLVFLDELTVQGYVSGFENHLWLVSSTDFNSDIDNFEKEDNIAEVVQRIETIDPEDEENKIISWNLKLGDFAKLGDYLQELVGSENEDN